MYEGPVIYESHVTDYFLLGLSIAVVVTIIVMFLLGLSKVFKKADQPSWKGFVPFYNLFPLLEIAHLPAYYFILLLIPIVNLIPIIQINRNLVVSFKKSNAFLFGLIFLAPIFYLILGFSEDRYVGINEEKVEEVVIRDLIKEQVDTTRPSMILKTDENISVGTASVSTNTSTAGILQADASILQAQKPQPVEYIDCPVCKNKVKKGAPVCFICGHKF